MNNYSFFQVVGGDGGLWYDCPMHSKPILKFFLKAVKLYGDAWKCTLEGK